MDPSVYETGSLAGAIMQASTRLGWPRGPRSFQGPIITRVLEGQSLVVVLPTGGGKSALYQIPALAFTRGVALVVSPLIALMIDQVDRLRRQGVPAAALHSHVPPAERKRILEDLQKGVIRVLYASPERLQLLRKEIFGETPISLVAIDEAHCISEWGHDFRPAYRRILQGLDRFIDPARRPPILAVTATATKEVSRDIAALLGISGDNILRFSPDRDNLAYGVAGPEAPLEIMVNRCGTPCIVYGSTKKSVEQAQEQLVRAGYKARFYHADLERGLRLEVQEQFASGAIEIIVATCAFGMGIDGIVRGVVHLEMPASLEAYVQEAGRAGRDGEPAMALCRATVETLQVARGLVSTTWPDPERVLRFWRRIVKIFENPPSSSFASVGKLHLPIARLAEMTGNSKNVQEVYSFLRILTDAGAIAQTAWQDLPVTIHLNVPVAQRLTGKKQRRVLDVLLDSRDEEDNITASISWFSEVAGLDRTFAQDLRQHNALRFDTEWAERAPLIERRVVDPQLDEVQIRACAQRAVERIDAAENFLKTPMCRRRYLLEHFGDHSGGRAKGICCDVCEKAKRAAAT